MRVQEISQENSFLVPLLANEHDVLLELEKNMLWEMGRKRIYQLIIIWLKNSCSWGYGLYILPCSVLSELVTIFIGQFLTMIVGEHLAGAPHLGTSSWRFHRSQDGMTIIQHQELVTDLLVHDDRVTVRSIVVQKISILNM